MLEKIRIQNFKALKDLEIDGFAKINIFIGQANTGKTSILEALYIYFADIKNEFISKILEFRGMIPDDDCFKSLFYDYQEKDKITLSGRYDGNNIDILLDIRHSKTSLTNFDVKQNNIIDRETDVLGLAYLKNGKLTDEISIKRSIQIPQQIQFEANIVSYEESLSLKSNMASFVYGGDFENEIKKHLKHIFEDKNKKENFKKNYQKFSNEIEEISFLGEKLVVQTQGLNKSVNFKLMGQGFQKYLYIQSAIFEGKKYIIIDELENGLHFESIDVLISTMLEAQDMQFFITTHNKELLKKISDKFSNKENSDKLAVFNIYKDKKYNVKASRYSQEDFIFNINQENEIRD